MTGLSRERATNLLSRLDLVISVEEIDVTTIDSRIPSPGTVGGGRFAGDAILEQDPAPNTRVAPGSTITFYIAQARPLRPGERSFRLLTHCGLSFPLEFETQLWLPVERKLRRTINAPEGFRSDGYYDKGSIRRIDENTIVYTSSTGVEAEYRPTHKEPRGCE
jgi:hypothetical protein